MTMLGRLLPLIGGLAALACSAAFAATAVSLKAEPVASGVVTLGDLFDGAGAAAAAPVGASVRAGGSVSLDAAALQRIARSAGLEWSNVQGYRVVIVRGGAAKSAGQTAVRRGEGVEVLTYTRNLNAGDIIEAEDLAWGEASAAPAGAPEDADEIIGKAVKRPLRAGAPVSGRDVAAPLVIKRDDLVQVLFRDGGVSLTLQAKAMGPASAGEPFKLQNVSSKKIIEAVATGPGRAVVGPEADRIRAAAEPSTLAYR